MTTLSGKTWHGSFNEQMPLKGRGVVNGYSWYFSAKASIWVLEIAEDQSIEPEVLPLVGFGCAGWLLEKKVAMDNDEISPSEVESFLTESFRKLNDNELPYIPAVPCSCSDFKIM